jgi:hypothetical protein
MRPLATHYYLGLGGLQRRTGDRAKAEEYFTIAATIRKVGTTF